MRIINRARGNGKSAMLVSAAYVTGMPILVANGGHKENIFCLADKMNISRKDIIVFTFDEWKAHSKGMGIDKILIDNTEDILGRVLSDYFGAEVVAGTMSVDMK